VYAAAFPTSTTVILALRHHVSSAVTTWRLAFPVIVDLTTPQNANICTGQCWYDNIVITPAGYPDMVYLGGSFSYNEYGNLSDACGVILSIGAGISFTDMT